jgi:poly(A) polymerase
VIGVVEIKIEPGIFILLEKIQRYFVENNIQGYLVGGFIRDLLLNRYNADIDVAVAGYALEIASRLAGVLNGTYVLLDEKNQVGRVVLGPGSVFPTAKRWYIDISGIYKDIEQDLKRRDFTIDAMAIDFRNLSHVPTEKDIIDLSGGINDLGNHLIRVSNETVFREDAARLLRAVRLAAELNFTLTPETETLIRNSGELVPGIAGERVREELLRILQAGNSGYYLHYMDRLGLLTAIIPELELSRGVEQPKEHFWDVLDHSIETVGALEFVLGQGPWQYSTAEIERSIPHYEKTDGLFQTEVSDGSTYQTRVKIAALLHDIAKPETKKYDGNKIRFIGHTDIGAEKASAILERLRFSNKEIKLVANMVRNHLRPTQMSNEGLPSHRAIYRFFRDTAEAAIGTLYLSLADHLAARGPNLDPGQWKEHVENVTYILERRLQEEGRIIPPKLISGHDLIDILGMKPGPEIKEILEEVQELQAAGEIGTKEQALYYAQNRLLYKERQKKSR